MGGEHTYVVSSLVDSGDVARARVSRRRLVWGYVLAVLGPMALVMLVEIFGPRPLSFETMIMMAMVVATALIGGLLPAVVAAVSRV